MEKRQRHFPSPPFRPDYYTENRYRKTPSYSFILSTFSFYTNNYCGWNQNNSETIAFTLKGYRGSSRFYFLGLSLPFQIVHRGSSKAAERHSLPEPTPTWFWLFSLVVLDKDRCRSSNQTRNCWRLWLWKYYR